MPKDIHDPRRVAAPPQPKPYGSPEQIAVYQRYRATSEGLFANWKSPAGEGIHGKRWRIGGITAHAFVVLAWAVAYNLRMQGHLKAPQSMDPADIIDYVNDVHAGCLGLHASSDKNCDHYPHDHTCAQEPPEVR